MESLPSLFIILFVFTCSFASCSSEIGRKELRTKYSNQGSVIRLGHSIQSNRIDPSWVLQVSWRPRVFLYRGFLSDEECDHLIAVAQNSTEKFSRNIVTNRLLKSSETPLNIKDDVVARIEERVSAWTFFPKEYSKPLQVIYYGLEEAKHNSDYFGNKSRLSLGVPLMATVVLYLSNVTRGGGIVFPESEPKRFKWSQLRSKIPSDCTKGSNILRPIKGNAVLFFSLNLNTSPDKNSAHTQCPVLEGEMWYATKFFHIKAINKKEASLDGEECEDEDENCGQWAALGECQRNSLYMMGSPDYYGTCRKSCNAC